MSGGTPAGGSANGVNSIRPVGARGFLLVNRALPIVRKRGDR